MKKLILIITGLVCAAAIVHAQSPPEIKPLHIGDTVPDITLNHIFNYKTTSAKFSDFKGKLVIIDFWATWCGGCLSMFSKLDQLQHKFKDQIIVLAVTKQETKTVKYFLQKRPKLNTVSFPIITKDVLLNKLFPHYYVPHEVIISPNGHVTAITSADEITPTNIKAILNNNNVQLAVKRDVSNKRPLFLGDGLPLNQLIHYSIFVKGRIAGLLSGNKITRSHNAIIGWEITNTPLLEMYRIAASFLISNFNRNRIIAHLTDSTDLFYTQQDMQDAQWKKDHLFSYNLTVPIQDTATFFFEMLQDLSRYSSYSGKIKKIKTTVWALTANNMLPDTLQLEKSAKLPNSKLATLVKRLNADRNIHYPVINEALNYNETINISSLDTNMNISSIQTMLSKYKLALRLVKREIPMLVLLDNNKQ